MGRWDIGPHDRLNLGLGAIFGTGLMYYVSGVWWLSLLIGGPMGVGGAALGLVVSRLVMPDDRAMVSRFRSLSRWRKTEILLTIVAASGAALLEARGDRFAQGCMLALLIGMPANMGYISPPRPLRTADPTGD